MIHFVNAFSNTLHISAVIFTSVIPCIVKAAPHIQNYHNVKEIMCFVKKWEWFFIVFVALYKSIVIVKERHLDLDSTALYLSGFAMSIEI